MAKTQKSPPAKKSPQSKKKKEAPVVASSEALPLEILELGVPSTAGLVRKTDFPSHSSIHDLFDPVVIERELPMEVLRTVPEGMKKTSGAIERVKKEHERTLRLLKARIAELQAEYDRYSTQLTSGVALVFVKCDAYWDPVSTQMYYVENPENGDPIRLAKVDRVQHWRVRELNQLPLFNTTSDATPEDADLDEFEDL